jgi:hypothetical protein
LKQKVSSLRGKDMPDQLLQSSFRFFAHPILDNSAVNIGKSDLILRENVLLQIDSNVVWVEDGNEYNKKSL